jgi:hypothetical protein
MKTYHKIQTLFLRDPETNYKRLMEGTWSKPEFQYLQNNIWIIDEKIDGTNIRILWNGIKVEIRGKTDNAQLHVDLITNLQEMFTPNKMAELFPHEDGQPEPNVCLYGEGCGAGIQKGGGNYGQDKHFKLFDVKVGSLWLERENVEDIGIKLGCDQAPAMELMSLVDAVELVRKGFNSKYGDFQAEGIIARPVVEMTNRYGERIITKLKHSDFNV